MVSQSQIILRLILSAVIGGLIGLEREANNRPAGLRTHILVTVGSTLIMLVSIDGFYDVETGVHLADPARLACQVVSGIGFLGAGTILRTGNHIKGLTTAASLWVCAGIGLAIGNGYYLGGLVTTGIVFLTLVSLRNFEKRVFKTNYKTLEITADNRPGIIGEIGVLLGRYNITIKDIMLSDNDDSIITTFIQIKLPHDVNLNEFIQDIHKINGIYKVGFTDEQISFVA